MFDRPHTILASAAAIGLALGLERSWRGFGGFAPLHAVPAALGAFLAIRQPGFTALFWFLPLQVLLWLLVASAVCMWAAERLPDAEGDFRGSGGVALSWTLALLLGVSCAFGAWTLVGAAGAALAPFGLRAPRRLAKPAPASAPTQAVEKGGAGETVGGAKPSGDLKRVDGEAGRAPDLAVGDAPVEAQSGEPLLHLTAA